MWNPRVGGEKNITKETPTDAEGSPPHGRGKAVKVRFTCGLQRITPAWAGKSNIDLQYISVTKDHPRVGGEKYDQWH